MHPDMTGLSTVNVDLEPGDLMIFNSLLAHGVRPNHSDNRVRMAQQQQRGRSQPTLLVTTCRLVRQMLPVLDRDAADLFDRFVRLLASSDTGSADSRKGSN